MHKVAGSYKGLSNTTWRTDRKVLLCLYRALIQSKLDYGCIVYDDPGMSLNYAPTRVCRKSASRPGYVVKVRTDPGYVVKQCPRIVMNKIFDWH